MKNLQIYCMCLNNMNLSQMKKVGYLPVGLKNHNFSKEWFRDNTLKNISKKKPILWRIYILLLVLEKFIKKEKKR